VSFECSDHFSRQASQYARYRPRYPAALFDYLASLSPARRHAWDCGTGSGQAAVALGDHFERVTATDISKRQLDCAEPHPRVSYRLTAAASVPIADQDCDLVVAAQALHWFDRDAFFREADRVLTNGGVLAALTYNLVESEPALDRVVRVFYHDVIGAYWPPERRHVENGYETIVFPYEELRPPSFAMEANWTRADLLGYLGSWSAVEQFKNDKDIDPVDSITDDLNAAWPNPGERKLIRWPLTLRVAKKTSA
jgi:SAM-dependent methyltransferase